jgi:TolA protein
MAAAMVAGQPPSDWDLYPAPAVLARFFGRPVPSLPEVADVLAPFPETVMIQLAKGILATNLAADDPTLLADSFEYTTPYVGPVRKPAYLEKYAAQEFANLDPQFEHFRVDPFDPFRVWVDVLPAGQGGYVGAPQAMSFTFDDDGFCTRLTTAYVMDPSIGNGGGLGGQEGYLYATDRASLPLLTRPWARVVGRIRKQVLSPLTGVAVDEYVAPAKKKAGVASQQRSSTSANVVASTPAERLSSMRPTGGASSLSSSMKPSPPSPPKLELPKPPAIPPINLQLTSPPKTKSSATPAPSTSPSPPRKSPENSARQARRAELEAQKKAAQERKAQIAEEKKKAAAEAKIARQRAKQTQLEAQRQRAAEKLAQTEAKREAARKAAEIQQATSAQKALAREKAAQEAAAAKKEQARQKAAALAAQKEAERKAAEEKKAAAEKEEARKKAQAAKKAVAAKKITTAPKKSATRPSPKTSSKETPIPSVDPTSRQRAALDAISNAVSRATVSLLGLVTNSSPEDDLPPAKPSTTKAPSGVPTIRRWKQNSDGSITGLISGSRIFNNGDKVTTSPIVKGTVDSGQVVRTGSGSRYFLD